MSNLLAICRVNISPVRAEKKDSSEMVSQFLFGEMAKVKEKSDKWLEVFSIEDNYHGYVDPKQFIIIESNVINEWFLIRKRTFKPLQIETPRGIMDILCGSYYAPKFTWNHQDYFVLNHSTDLKKSWENYAYSFLNTSYLWGGRTHYGIDCSGFTQQVMRYRSIEISRDASKQVLEGHEVSFENKKAGDLAFFHNENNRITHVGIVLEDSKIIHASGFVKIDLLKSEGIECIEKNEITHPLHSIRRYL